MRFEQSNGGCAGWEHAPVTGAPSMGLHPGLGAGERGRSRLSPSATRERPLYPGWRRILLTLRANGLPALFSH